MDPTPNDCSCLNPARPTTSATWLGDREGLSAHEVAIVALIVLGLSDQEISDVLHMSLYSVTTHIRSAYRKVGAVEDQC